MPEVSEPMLDPSLPEYPTEDQMNTMFNAYIKDGKAGILAVLKATRQKQEQNGIEDAPRVKAERREIGGRHREWQT